ncbi:MAG: hypothetical protein KatS3mg024_0777 [Armatimonadota bacterium]|nr:MAG: hypothetical protein KatS3mg024_0777 [Armatimonadota bacterium]
MTRIATILMVFAAAAMVASLALQADAQGWRGGAGRGGGRGAAAIGLVPGVQLTPEQERQVAQIRSETMQRVQQIRWDSSLTPEQIAAEIAKVRQEGHERVMNVLTPEQRQQFQSRWPGAAPGVGLGRGPCGAGLGRGAGMGRGAGRGIGPGAAWLGAGYGMSGLVPGVQLTAEQQERIRQIRQDGARQVAAVMADPNLTAQERALRVQEIRTQTHEQVMSVFTPEQRRQFEQRARAWQGWSRPTSP